MNNLHNSLTQILTSQINFKKDEVEVFERDILFLAPNTESTYMYQSETPEELCDTLLFEPGLSAEESFKLFLGSP